MIGKRIVVGAVGLCLVCSSCFFLPKEEELPAAPVVYNYQGDPYETVTVTRGDLVKNVEVICKYSAIREEELSFLLSDEVIEEVYVQQGDRVTAGTVMAQLALGDVKEQLTACENQIEVLALQLEQTRENRDAAYTRQEEYLSALSSEERAGQQSPSAYAAGYMDRIEELEDALQVQKFKRDELKRTIKERQIVATMDGLVSYARSVRDGDLSSREDVMFEVSDNDTSAFIGTSDQKDLLKVGQTVNLRIGEEDRPATVISPGEHAVPTEKGVQYYFQLDTPDPSLKNGDKATLNVEIERRSGVLYLPEAAIRKADGKAAVYYQNADGVREMKFVEIGLTADHKTEIKSGVSEGETIIIG